MDDLTLARYTHIARRVQALLEDPWLAATDVPETFADQDVTILLADTAFRLALYRAAMPGTSPTGVLAPSVVLDALQHELRTIGSPALEHVRE